MPSKDLFVSFGQGLTLRVSGAHGPTSGPLGEARRSSSEKWRWCSSNNSGNAVPLIKK